MDAARPRDLRRLPGNAQTVHHQRRRRSTTASGTRSSARSARPACSSTSTACGSATGTDTTAAQDYTGYWRIGGDNTVERREPYFAGDIDDVAIYPTALTPAAGRRHWVASGRTSSSRSPGRRLRHRVFTRRPDLYWRLGEPSGSTVAADS